MITIESIITPKQIYKLFSWHIRSNRRNFMPDIEESLYELCKYYDTKFNIDKDYLFQCIALPILSIIMGERFTIYHLLAPHALEQYLSE